jgi:hypothetical protein
MVRLTLAVNVNSVQQEVQQQGRTVARTHDRGHHWLAADGGRSSGARR